MKVEELRFLGDRVLIKPSKFITYKQTDWVKDPEANKGKDPLKDEMVMKEETKQINADFQKGIVVAVGNLVTNVKVGDEIVYNIRACAQFDLIKGLGILKPFDLVAVINK